jgi:hypothetical protein
MSGMTAEPKAREEGGPRRGAAVDLLASHRTWQWLHMLGLASLARSRLQPARRSKPATGARRGGLVWMDARSTAYSQQSSGGYALHGTELTTHHIKQESLAPACLSSRDCFSSGDKPGPPCMRCLGTRALLQLCPEKTARLSDPTPRWRDLNCSIMTSSSGNPSHRPRS